MVKLVEDIVVLTEDGCERLPTACATSWCSDRLFSGLSAATQERRGDVSTPTPVDHRGLGDERVDGHGTSQTAAAVSIASTARRSVGVTSVGTNSGE